MDEGLVKIGVRLVTSTLYFRPIDVSPVDLLTFAPHNLRTVFVSVLTNAQSTRSDGISKAVGAKPAVTFEANVLGEIEEFVGAEDVLRETSGSAIVIADVWNFEGLRGIQITLIHFVGFGEHGVVVLSRKGLALGQCTALGGLMFTCVKLGPVFSCIIVRQFIHKSRILRYVLAQGDKRPDSTIIPCEEVERFPGVGTLGSCWELPFQYPPVLRDASMEQRRDEKYYANQEAKAEEPRYLIG